MKAEEAQIAIEELEYRLERLRSLYEQYFLGIEKIEPTIARKDVDRRIWLLRREQIRNTARRFKLQTVIQRYNTFQQYWQRICREIENGTYKRHLLRAAKNFGPDQALTIASRKRFKNWDKQAAIAAAEKAEETRRQLEADLGAALESATYDPLQEAKRAVDAALARTAPDPGRRAASGPAQPSITKSTRPQRPVRAAPRDKLDRLELDLDADFAGTPATGVACAERPGVAVATPLPARPAPPVRPAVTTTSVRGAAPRRTPAGDARRAGVSDARVQELHARLVDARKQTHDHRNISVDNLKKSLDAAECRLRKQHGNRRIDFDVVIKDGKAVVKPIVH